MKFLNSRPRGLGFTIIEILVVIGILSIVSSFTFVSFDRAREKGKDQKRKEDLKQIAAAALSYYQDKGFYPPDPAVNIGTNFASDGGANWIPDLSTYLPKPPKDPNQSGILQTLAKLFKKLPKYETRPQVAGAQTISPPAENTDGYINYNAKDFYPGDPPASGGTCQSNAIAQSNFLGQRQIFTTNISYRGYLAFNTSSIGSTATITSAFLNLTIAADPGTTALTDFNVKVRYFNWSTSGASGIDCPADWTTTLPTLANTTNYNTISLPAVVGETIPIPLQVFTGINKTGTTYIMLTSDREEDTPTDPTGDEYFAYYNKEESNFPPTLTVNFTTPNDPPTVTTSAATGITSTSATLNGSANPNGNATTAWFRYSSANPGTCNDTFGTKVPAAGSSLGSGTSNVSIPSQTRSNLNSGITYYYCAIANNAYGTSFGSIVSFITSSGVTPTPSCSPASQTVAVNQQATLTASGGSGSYTWSSAPAGGSIAGSGSNITFTSSSPNSYTVTVTSGGQSANCTVNVVASVVNTACDNKKNIYCYIVVADRSSFIIWAQLQNSKDPQRYDQPGANCTGSSPVGGNLNYCLKSPN